MSRVLLPLIAVSVASCLFAGNPAAEIVVSTRVGNFNGLVRYAPMPTPPPAAVAQHLTGHGVYAVDIGVGGLVDDVRVVRSTGHPILDEAAVAALRKWVVVPHTLYKLTVPLDFSAGTPTRTERKQTRQ